MTVFANLSILYLVYNVGNGCCRGVRASNPLFPEGEKKVSHLGQIIGSYFDDLDLPGQINS